MFRVERWFSKTKQAKGTFETRDEAKQFSKEWTSRYGVKLHIVEVKS